MKLTLFDEVLVLVNNIYKMEFEFDELKIKDCNRNADELKDKLFRLLTSMGLKREINAELQIYIGSGTNADRDLFFSSIIFISRAEWLIPYLKSWQLQTPDQGTKNMMPLIG